MYRYHALISFSCVSVEEAEVMKQEIQRCLDTAVCGSRIADRTLDMRQETLCQITIPHEYPDKEVKDLPMGLACDEIFVPDPKVL